MKIYKEIKEIAKCNSKIDRLAGRIKDKFPEEIDTESIDWRTAKFVTMNQKLLKSLEQYYDEYYCEQHNGYHEDDFYGWLYFKTDVPGQYVQVYFEC